MSKEVISSVEKHAEDFILNNNIFIDVGDPYSKFVTKGIEGISTWGVPNITAHIKKIKSKKSIMYPGKVLYDTTYTFDSFGRRTTVNIGKDKNKVGIFFGDSMTFGEGLPDTDTIPSIFSDLNKEYFCYNYGFFGHGPSHMLVHLLSEDFQKQFKDKSGDIFYIFRDDAIRVCTGQVPYNYFFPKFTYTNSKLDYNGSFNPEDGYPTPLHIPSSHTKQDYDLIVNIFKEADSIVKSLSSSLTFNIVILPLCFTHKLLQKDLVSTNINVYNLYRLDLAHHSKNKARFLDGIHTRIANEIVLERLNFFFRQNTFPHEYTKLESYKTIEEIIRAVKIETFMLPVMEDFPHDDASVITALILYNSEIDIPSNIDFLDIAKKHFDKKKNLIKNLTFNETKEELRDKDPILKEIPILVDMIYKEYYEYKK